MARRIVKKSYPMVDNFHTAQSKMTSTMSTVMLFFGTSGTLMVPELAPSIVMLAIGGFFAVMAKPIMAFGYKEAINPGQSRSGQLGR